MLQTQLVNYQFAPLNPTVSYCREKIPPKRLDLEPYHLLKRSGVRGDAELTHGWRQKARPRCSQPPAELELEWNLVR